MSKLPRVVLFDDEEANLKLYGNYFRDHYDLEGFQNPHLYGEVLKHDISAILVDVLMPMMNGIELYTKLRENYHYNGCPIIFISGSNNEELMLKALSSGGQDFLSRTMKKDEMVIRINNKISNFNQSRHIFILGTVKLNTYELKAYHSNKVVDLTLTEMKILKFLILNHKSISSREEINQAVWPNQKVIPTTLNTHLSNLRIKFSDWEYEIQFVKSKGVSLVLKERA